MQDSEPNIVGHKPVDLLDSRLINLAHTNL